MSAGFHPAGPGGEPQLPTDLSVTSSREVAVGFAWLSTTQVVQILFFLAFTPALARLLTPSDFGVMAAATLVLSFVDTFSTLALGHALVQRKTLSTSHSGSALTVSMLMSTALAAGLVAAAPGLADTFRIPALQTILRTLAFMVPLTALATISQFILQRNLRFRALALADLVPQVAATALVAIPLAALGLGFWSLVIAAALAATARTAVLAILAAAWLKPALCARSLRELLGYGVPYTGTSLLIFAATRFDQLVIVRLLGEASLGLYNRITAILNPVVAILGSSADRVLFPLVSQHQDDPGYLRRSYFYLVRLSSLICLPLSAAVAMHARAIIHILLGAQWLHATVPLAVLAGALFFRITHSVVDTFHRSLGLVKRQGAIYGVYTGAVVGFTLFGVRWGLTGAACGLSLAVVIHFMLLTASLWSRLRFGLGKALRSHASGVPPAAAVLALSLAARWVTSEFGAPALVSVFVFAGLCLVLASLALLWIRRTHPGTPLLSALRSFIDSIANAG
ncbi:MAG TPA: lipopolysaccharide biosynthesis protein [Thermoanaerobaculaceae bacterium]|nr:lipopolysaccharide biosynthesis protein [Thermoanaerobaculaceae bacterium]HRS14931.1 lipopolysaccharide biosynthesis protein [Thermoanaerobaculaceae bacterium]